MNHDDQPAAGHDGEDTTALDDDLELWTLEALTLATAADAAASTLEPEWFAAPHHGRICAAAQALARQGTPPALPLVRAELARAGHSTRETEAALLALVGITTSPAPLPALVRAFAEQAYQRQYRARLSALLDDLDRRPLAESRPRLREAGTDLARLARAAGLDEDHPPTLKAVAS